MPKLQNPLGWIYLLPSETISVIVKYDPKWAISCVIPATEKRIKSRFIYEDDHDYDGDDHDYNYVTKEHIISVPTLLLSHAAAKPWMINSLVPKYSSIFAIDLDKKDGIFATPYRLANVYPSGKICFGDIGEPSNLRRAYNIFWDSFFTEDNCPYITEHRQTCPDVMHVAIDYPEDYGHKNENCPCSCCLKICGCHCECDLNSEFFNWIDTYNQKLTQIPFTKKTNTFCGRKYFAYPKAVEALFFSNNAEVFEKIPSTCMRHDYQNEKIIIGTAKIIEDSWEIDLGSYQFSIKSNEANIV